MAIDDNEDGILGSKRKRGRPPGTRNRPKVLPPPQAMEDYRHADPETIVSRQLSMLDWAQQAFRGEMRRAMEQKNPSVSGIDVVKLEKLSHAIVQAIIALKKTSDLTEELRARLTPEEVLEKSIAKCEAQDLRTLRYIIKRLRARRDALEPATSAAPTPISSAADAINALED